MDAGQMLKPMLARGELRVVGATTLDEYRKHVEKDAALERRFQPVFVGEPNVESTIAILRGLKERYEAHHGVRITDGAVIAAATLSHRYIGDRFLPDKAIDLLDEAASRMRIEIDSMPQEIDEVERRIMQLDIERTALQKEKDAAAVERRTILERELAELKERSAAMKAQWQQEKDTLGAVGKIKQQIDQARVEAEQASRAGDLGKAAEISYGRIPQLEREMKEAESKLASHGGRPQFLKEEVGAEDIAEACRIPTAPSGASSSSVPPESARRRRRVRWRSSCSTTSTRWCASTCRSTWRSTPWRGSSARRRATWATRKAASSPRRCGVAPIL
jgi:ATP-dependent Clp protease ATP-binding subunit ClpB